MTAIAETIAETEATRRAAAWKDYREILARADAPKPKDAERLTAALAALGLTAADFDADHAAVRHMAELAKAVRPDADVAAEVQLCEDDRGELEGKFRELLKKAVDRLDPLHFDFFLTQMVRTFATSVAQFQQFDEIGRGLLRLTNEAVLRRDRIQQAQAQATRAVEQHRLTYPRAMAAIAAA